MGLTAVHLRYILYPYYGQLLQLICSRLPPKRHRRRRKLVLTNHLYCYIAAAHLHTYLASIRRDASPRPQEPPPQHRPEVKAWSLPFIAHRCLSAPASPETLFGGRPARRSLLGTLAVTLPSVQAPLLASRIAPVRPFSPPSPVMLRLYPVLAVAVCNSPAPTLQGFQRGMLHRPAIAPPRPLPSQARPGQTPSLESQIPLQA